MAAKKSEQGDLCREESQVSESVISVSLEQVNVTTKAQEPVKSERENGSSVEVEDVPQKGGGFECEFVEKPPSMIQTECPVCLLVLREPYQVICCGNSFCRVCIERINENDEACPICKEESLQLFPNKGLQKPLYQFEVRCTHQKEGCKWTGKLGELDNHLNLEPEIDKELVGCDYAEIDCRYGYVECNARLTRLQMRGHLKNEMDIHLSLLEKQYKTQTSELEEAQMEISTLNEKLSTIDDNWLKKIQKYFPIPPFTMTMKHFGYHWENRKEWFSTPFYTDFRGYNMCLRVDLQVHTGMHTYSIPICTSYTCTNDHYMCVQLCLIRGEFDTRLQWPFEQEVELEVVSQDATIENQKTVIYHKTNKTGWNWGQNIAVCVKQVTEGNYSKSFIGTKASRQLIQACNVHNFVHNDSMEFRITYAGPYREDRV